jgi:hypothetical protein
MAADPAGNVFFSGSFAGIYRTRDLREKASNTSPIPPDVAQREQYNHIGDIAWDAGEGGRLLLPLESYTPFGPEPNPSKTGSIGVMDANTLSWRYYVKLDPAEIAKTQWVATTPDGLVWTISGSDLLAYNLADVNPANAAPDGPVLHAVKRLPGVAPGGAGGAVWFGGRLYMSVGGAGVSRIVSVDLQTGATQAEYEQAGKFEVEGMDAGGYAGGVLHWELVPGGGLNPARLVNLLPKGAPLRVKLAHAHVAAGRPAKVSATVTVTTSGYTVAVPGVELRVGRAHATTDANGRATLKVKLTRGAYRAQAFYKGLRTSTAKLRAT